MSVDLSASTGIMLQLPDGHIRSLRQIESDVICLAMSHYRGNMSETARHLHIGRMTLYRKLGEIGIDVNDRNQP
jgi:DNA-binding NtrC family response regulator